MPYIKKSRIEKRKNEQVEIALNHIDRYFELAKKRYSSDKRLSDRYVYLARNIAMKFRIKLPSRYKRLFCPHCYKFMMPQSNCRIRVHNHKIIYYCLECKKFWKKYLSKDANYSKVKT